MEKEINKRYKDLLSRSYKSDLYLFLFQSYINGYNEKFSVIDEYSKFIPNEELLNHYVSIHQLAKSSDIISGTDLEVGHFDLFLKEWLKNNKHQFKELKDIYTSRFLTKEDFCSFYISTPKQCYYCHITEELIEELVNGKRIYTKRLFSRGRVLEIDRKNSLLTYTKDNIVFCCYWCNNAKTDEFSLEEFLPVGEQISNIWNARLRKKV